VFVEIPGDGLPLQTYILIPIDSKAYSKIVTILMLLLSNRKDKRGPYSNFIHHHCKFKQKLHIFKACWQIGCIYINVLFLIQRNKN
jgi:hypothetical protein